jgi:hypothetical protein
MADFRAYMRDVVRPLIAAGVIGVMTLGQVQSGEGSIASDQAAPAPARGNATISGQAFVITIRGEVIPAARARVRLLPVTELTTYWYEQATKHGRSVPPADPQLQQLSTWRSTDERGAFEFAALPAGDYYLLSQLTPGAHTGYAILPGGIVLHNRVDVGAGESANVVLTAQVQPGVGLQ